MSLLRADAIGIAFGATPLLSDVSFAIEAKERIALVGRNGEGKSTLLKILAGELAPDSGQLVRRQGVRVAMLRQDVPEDIDGAVEDVVARGLSETGQLLADFQQAARELATGEGDERRLGALQSRIDAVDGWQLAQRVAETLSRMSLDAEADFGSLSGGLKRRVLLARALLAEPDVLLLDEPTNHLDIAAIDWLERHLAGLPCALVFITHDRAFLERLATRILELDRGSLSDWPGNYADYKRRRQAQLDEEERHQALFDRKLAEEERWIRQGIKARRTRNEGRVRALKALREARRQRIERVGKASITVNAAEKSGKRVIEATDVNYAIDGKVIVRDFSLTILRGDRIGIIGPNGIGKSTLLRLLLGEIEPDSGRIEQGTRLDIAYFDQLRSALDTSRSAMDNVSEGRDEVVIGRERKHIIGYMQDFLFSPARARAPISALSGGETNRLMLARLFVKPSNFLVLDEPTNDLDIETLELLESLIGEYPGTVIIISHDRAFVNNTVTSTLVFEGDGRISEHVGGYDDIPAAARELLERPAESAGRVQSAGGKTGAAQGGKAGAAQGGKAALTSTAAATLGSDGTNGKPGSSARPAKPATSALTYGEEIELGKLPDEIDALETELAALDAELGNPELYASPDAARPVIEAADALRQTLAERYARWDELEMKLTGVS